MPITNERHATVDADGDGSAHMDADGGGDTNYAKLAAKYLFSHVGLAVLVVIYVVGGAKLFMHVEGPTEEYQLLRGLNESHRLEEDRMRLAADLWNYKWSPDYNVTVEKILNEYHANVSKAIKNYKFYMGLPLNESQLSYGWSFSSALLFTVSVVTTIGYGHVCPVTELGQLLVIAYALLGVPLMLMFLANIGDAMANFFRIAYAKGCCYCCHKRRSEEYQKYREEVLNNRRVVDFNQHNPKNAWDTDTVGDVRKRKGFNEAERGVDDMGDDFGPQVIDMADDEIVDEAVNVPISLTLVIIAAYVFIGAILFAAWNDWTWISGAYFSFVTLSTIGFGDLVPGWSQLGTTEGTVKLIISAVYIILGLAVLSMSFNLMMEEMIAKFRWLGMKIGIIDDPNDLLPETDESPLVHGDSPYPQQQQHHDSLASPPPPPHVGQTQPGSVPDADLPQIA